MAIGGTTKVGKLSKSYVKNVQRFPTRCIQFGEGNFLRAFIDWQIQQMNKQGLFQGGVTIIQPLPGGIVHKFAEQDYLFTVILEGIVNGQNIQSHEIISSVNSGINPYEDYDAFLKLADDDNLRFIFSNTTEAGNYGGWI
jgi:tagaturonate reductase